ncbi:hypothetical protein E2P81_ATG00456 [Venturia nashicola]|uniref:Uncharacterized protein n=1 Tax=Venturia nashicola TaxID=86259 RepID=A0A4Z1PNE7_9PEZI|nr:hypothetical protein E6O75_ATG00466 [Venturia nashicola]TLD39469.1 hypothetical protein E2P81_ATG00456 [Venturia nashicola]
MRLSLFIVAIAAAVSAAPIATSTFTTTQLHPRQLGDLLCAHDHLHMSADCNTKKKAAGDKGIVADLLGLSLAGGPKTAAT